MFSIYRDRFINRRTGNIDCYGQWEYRLGNSPANKEDFEQAYLEYFGEVFTDEMRDRLVTYRDKF